jgi:GT2 family glycosyltransferase
MIRISINKIISSIKSFLAPTNVLTSYDTRLITKISIIVVVRSLDKRITNMIRSILSQEYVHWQLHIIIDQIHAARLARLTNHLSDSRIIVLTTNNLDFLAQANLGLSSVNGQYIGMINQSDYLHPQCLSQFVRAIFYNQFPSIIYSDEAKYLFNPRFIIKRYLKPDWSFIYLTSVNYIHRFALFYATHAQFDSSYEQGLYLRLTHDLPAQNMVHVKQILCFCDSWNLTIKPHRFNIHHAKLVSIIILDRGHADELRRCLSSVFKSSYSNFEVIVLKNTNTTKEFYSILKRQYDCEIITSNQCNRSDINNYAAQHAKGDYLVFLSNATEVITKSWLEEMLYFAERDNVGIVGAKLYYADYTIQHAGICTSYNYIARHIYQQHDKHYTGHMYRAVVANEVSAVTDACMMINKNLFHRINGFDAALAHAYNDVDLCLKVRQLGFDVVFTPHAELYHFTSKALERDNTLNKLANEQIIMRNKWSAMLNERYHHYPI